jgi:hypothetical protein
MIKKKDPLMVGNINKILKQCNNSKFPNEEENLLKQIESQCKDKSKKGLFVIVILSNKNERIEKISHLLSSVHGFETNKQCDFSVICNWGLDARKMVSVNELKDTIKIVHNEVQKNGCKIFDWRFDPDSIEIDILRADHSSNPEESDENIKQEDETKIVIKQTPKGKDVLIDDKPFTTVLENGLIASAADLQNYNPASLGYFYPILVPFGCNYCKDNKLDALGEHVTASFTIEGKSNIVAFVTITDPKDIEMNGKHEVYQKALYNAVLKNRSAWFPEGYSIDMDNNDAAKLIFVSENFKFSPVGYCQFLILMDARTYKEVFADLNIFINNLETEARAKMK